MQKIIMLSPEGGCIFNSPVAEQVLTTLAGKALSADAQTIYKIDEEFYFSFRADFPDFTMYPVLVSFIQKNIGKHIYVNKLVGNSEYVLEIQAMLTEITDGGEYYQATNIISDEYRRYLTNL